MEWLSGNRPLFNCGRPVTKRHNSARAGTCQKELSLLTSRRYCPQATGCGLAFPSCLSSRKLRHLAGWDLAWWCGRTSRVALVASGFSFQRFQGLTLLYLGVWLRAARTYNALGFGMRSITRYAFAELLFSFAFSFARWPTTTQNQWRRPPWRSRWRTLSLDCPGWWSLIEIAVHCRSPLDPHQALLAFHDWSAAWDYQPHLQEGTARACS